MTLGSPLPAPEPLRDTLTTAPETGARLWCTVCDTDAYVFVEIVAETPTGPPHTVEVSYTCSECDTFYAHAVTMEVSPHVE